MPTAAAVLVLRQLVQSQELQYMRHMRDGKLRHSSSALLSWSGRCFAGSDDSHRSGSRRSGNVDRPRAAAGLRHAAARRHLSVWNSSTTAHDRAAAGDCCSRRCRFISAGDSRSAAASNELSAVERCFRGTDGDFAR